MEPTELICADAPGGFGERTRAVVGVVIALGYFVVFATLERAGLSIHEPTLSLASKWLIAPVLLIWAIKVERLSLSALGLRRPTWGTLAFALVAIVTTFLAMGFYYRVVAPHFGAQAAPPAVSRLAHLPFHQLLLMSLSAGLVEELVFRFYAISRLDWLTGNPWIASLAPLLVFVGLHLPSFGVGQIILVTIGATVLTGLYWLRRDFWANALAHGLIDLAGLTLAAHAGR